MTPIKNVMGPNSSLNRTSASKIIAMAMTEINSRCKKFENFPA
ncbi:hypothetical protein NSP_39730 [Nodularia spumigena CCY9414]|nr:hypothetical protein NSP_39730 [Nodularia spumigena CCY9414]